MEFIILCVFLASCGKPFLKNTSKGNYYLYKNSIEVIGGNLIKIEKNNLIQKLNAQLDDSSKIKVNKKFILWKIIKNPIIFDSSYALHSAENMKASLFHLGYYNAVVNFVTDTNKNKIAVKYLVETGKPTVIDTITYHMLRQDLQKEILDYRTGIYLKQGTPITKAGVITEVARLVDSFRNNGYYKFTAAELNVTGDTTNEALTFLSDDPFEQLRILAEAQLKKDSPKIKIDFSLNIPSDSARLNKFHINKIFVLSDYRQGDNINDTSLKVIQTKNLIIKYHNSLFKEKIWENIISLKPGELFSQYNFNKTLYQCSKTGVWQSVNIQINELKDSNNLVDLVVELIPIKKFGFETALELSYSASTSTSNIIAGNLFGLSGNITLLNRNLGKNAIRMTHNIRAGIELNNNISSNGRLVNSNEVGYSNTTSFPKLIFPSIPNLFNKKSGINNGESFINLGFSYNTRVNLFNLQTFTGSFGWSGSNKHNWKWVWTPVSFGFSNLFNKSDSFSRILDENPFLNYSYNTPLVTGMGVSFSKTRSDFNHPNSLSKELSLRINAEESGLTLGLLPIFTNYKRRYIKSDLEVKHTIRYNKSTLAFRGFVGVGVPLLGSDTNKTLPFFKQYFGGGSNSMRAWPVRGIGPGGKSLNPFSSTKNIFNDRTGDMQIEANVEYRYKIASIIPNTLTLRGAVFTDIGNIWNTRSISQSGIADSTQFLFKNLYSQLGVTAGTGFRLDFNYFVLRLDFGFRFKRPELYYVNDGWKAPDIGFKDCLKKIFTKGENDIYRKWRYENFNFTIGIGYSF
jgi:hypothetical protein